mmetsp:Transcript_67268/g.208548  ORF Transcript_67268/g.208548 Transcript_67268/m.208548 type:complete len:225 (+) Transcript_67268:114-788(+)
MTITCSRLSSISLISVSTASTPKTSFGPCTRAYASSMKRTPPSDSFTSFCTLGAVWPLYSATRSAREASRNLKPSLSLSAFGLIAPIASNNSPTMRATTVLPVPGLPKKRMCKLWPAKLPRPFSSRALLKATRSSMEAIASFTFCKPTSASNFAFSSATRSSFGPSLFVSFALDVYCTKASATVSSSRAAARFGVARALFAGHAAAQSSSAISGNRSPGCVVIL